MAKRKAFQLRIQPELWEELNRWAGDEFRSLNGHIEFLLRRAVTQRRGGVPGGDAPPTKKPPGPEERGATDV